MAYSLKTGYPSYPSSGDSPVRRPPGNGLHRPYSLPENIHDPLEAFTSKNMTSILDVIREGSGSVPANFRLIPESARDDAIRIFRKLERAGISGLLGVGRGGEDVLGVPVDDGMVGVAIIGV